MMGDRMSELKTDTKIPFVVQPMLVRDIPEVMAIEKNSFPTPWSATAYRHELTQNELSHYIVVRRREPPGTSSPRRSLARWLRKPGSRLPPIVGYGGFWVLDDEAHISTIAVRPDWRGHGLGELLLAAMIDLAISLKARFVTLEVRVSNLVAQTLYRKYLFEQVGRRRRYYRDNDEDGVIMTTPPIDDPKFLETRRQHRQALYARLSKLAADNAEYD
jgi:ribosomal-protein-alanine N-acetyltransferase